MIRPPIEEFEVAIKEGRIPVWPNSLGDIIDYIRHLEKAIKEWSNCHGADPERDEKMIDDLVAIAKQIPELP